MPAMAKYALTPRSPTSGSLKPSTMTHASHTAMTAAIPVRAQNARRRSGHHAPTV